MAEGKNLYETVIVTSAKLGEEGNAELVEKFKSLIERHGGTVQSVDDWGKRRFAYPIEKQTEGYYTLINFESDPEFTAELDRRYQITDGIVRTLIVKRDPRFVNSSKPARPETEEAEAVEEAPAEEKAEVAEAPAEEAPVEEAEASEVPAEPAPEAEPAEQAE